jgi:carboxypeptidase Taq
VSAAVDELRAIAGEISDLGRARALLAWDERTKMPPAGQRMRAEQLATLTRLRHQRLSSDELGRALDAVEAELPEDAGAGESLEASLVRMTRREWDKARRVPAELRADTARATSLAERAWEQAREKNDFVAFLPHLERVIELRRRYIECFDVEHPYDALLDDFEPGMTTATLEPVLDALQAGTVELLGEIDASGTEVDSSCLFGEFEIERQDAFAQELAALLPLEPGAWRVDETVHPFATGIAISDLRITTRFDPSYVGTSLWAVAHEVGHALYNNGLDPALERTILCRSASLGFDESSSRMWENWVGRGRPFISFLLPALMRHFPETFSGLETETVYRAANRVERSPIRVEADEVTYNLHIALRFELEVELFSERLQVAELPEAWKARTKELLGLELSNDTEGVLQDVHWGAGSFGYFPTYSLGNIIAGQVWELARAELPELDSQLAAGELVPLRDFLRERVYGHGGRMLPAELIEKITGGPLDPAPLLRHLRAKFGEIYGFSS